MGGIEGVASVPTPLLIAIVAGVATWLIAFGFAAERRERARQRSRVLAKIRGVQDEPQGAIRKRRRRRRPRLALRRRGNDRFSGMRALLTRSGVSLQPREFLVVEGISASIGVLAAGALFGTAGMLFGALLGFVLPLYWLRRKANARHAKINGQLNELLQTVAGGLAAGQSFMQSLESASRELDEPLRSELRLLLSEVELGASIEDALVRLGVRVQDEDFDLVIDAVLIQRRVGGNLSEVLNNISWTIRERIRIRGDVKALTGQARLSGWILGGLPVFIAGALFLVSRDYMMVLVEAPIGRLLILGGVMSEAVGMFLMRKIADIKV